MPVDLAASRLWVIQHHPLFHTYIHHDASGTATWTMVASGSKFWILAVPKYDSQCKSLSELHEQNMQYYITDDEETGDRYFPYAAQSDRYCIYAHSGDMMYVLLAPRHDYNRIYGVLDFNLPTRGTKCSRPAPPLLSADISIHTTLCI